MFRLITIEDNIRIEPQDLKRDTVEAITHMLEQTFLDRVITNVGLVVTLYDILSVGEGAIYHSDGGVHYKVCFRVVVFQPFINELLVGSVKDMDENGLTVSLGFFDDIHIPPEMLQQPAVWNAEESEWCWLMDEDSAPLFYSRKGEIRLKVHAVEYSHIPSLQFQAEERKCGELVTGSAAKPHVPMLLCGRADSTGLGMISWAWGGEDE